MFDPYAEIVYDYMGGMQDIKNAKVCMYLLSFVKLSVAINLFGLDANTYDI